MLIFNGGDFFFYPFNASKYKGKLRNFKDFFKNYCAQNQIDIIICYNDCRPLHAIAIRLARQMDIEVFVFEEGYLRPNFITLEKNGVNANSKMPRNASFYLNYTPKNLDEKIKNINGAFKFMGFFAFLYWLFAFLLAPFYNNALHHRKLNPLECLYWARSLYRKIYYKRSEKGIKDEILKSKGGYFVAILQVFNDTQISKHYKGGSIENFITQTLKSFAGYARDKHSLVFKHHPMDRGYKNYSALIKERAKALGIEDRVFYIHNFHLPTLFSNALGCVTINSTAGLSALYHKCALKVVGAAFYDFAGLTYQGDLNFFWKEAHANKPNYMLYKKFIDYLLDTNQINANYYKNSAFFKELSNS